VNNPPTSLVEKWEAAEKECSRILIGTLIEHHEAEVEASNNKFNDTILAGVNIVIPEFITTVPDIAKRCELAITKVKDSQKQTKKFNKKRPSPAHPSEEPASKRAKNSKGPFRKKGAKKEKVE